MTIAQSQICPLDVGQASSGTLRFTNHLEESPNRPYGAPCGEPTNESGQCQNPRCIGVDPQSRIDVGDSHRRDRQYAVSAAD